MKKKSILYFGVAAIVVVVIVVEALSNKPIVWTKTFSRYDKNPYGSYALGQLMQSVFPDKQVTKSNLTYYEIVDQHKSAENFISISNGFFPDSKSSDSLLAHIHKGNTALISAANIIHTWQDTLGIKLKKTSYEVKDILTNKDSTTFSIVGRDYSFYKSEMLFEIEEYPTEAEILGKNEANQPIALTVPFGKGKVIVCTVPILFTNYFMLYEENHRATSDILAALPVADTHWTEYHQVGKLQSGSPLRVLLNYVPLRYALYSVMVLILLYILFEAKRKQRIIPVIRRPVNQTVQFIQTVGNLYLNTGNHKASAVNQIYYFKEYLTLKHRIHLADTRNLSALIAAKSGKDEALISSILTKIKTIEQSNAITETLLVELNRDLYHFYHK